MLLAAGFGTRLRPLTDITPKCLVTIKGQKLLGIWLESLWQAGIRSYLINTHYLAGQVIDFVESSPYRKNIKLVNENKLKGTAGTLISNLDFFQGEDGLLIHADNYCLADFSNFRKAHYNRPQECLMTMMVFRTDIPSSCGIVEVNTSGVGVGFYEKIKNPPGNLANGAVYIISSELIKILQCDYKNVRDFSNEVLPDLVGRIFCYETTDLFLDIGTPEAYEKANQS